jgi:hypothetical protein
MNSRGPGGKPHTRIDVEEAIGRSITSDEWTKIKMHARWLGGEIRRMRVDKALLVWLLRFFSPGNSQR